MHRQDWECAEGLGNEKVLFFLRLVVGTSVSSLHPIHCDMDGYFNLPLGGFPVNEGTQCTKGS